PDGVTIVFNGAGEGGWDLYLLDLETRRVRRLAQTPGYELTPRFAPDGEAVVYAAGTPGDRADHLFLRSLDGGPAVQLTRGESNDCSPSFAPDGSRIVFTRSDDYHWGGLGSNWNTGGQIRFVRPDGTLLPDVVRD